MSISQYNMKSTERIHIEHQKKNLLTCNRNPLYPSTHDIFITYSPIKYTINKNRKTMILKSLRIAHVENIWRPPFPPQIVVFAALRRLRNIRSLFQLSATQSGPRLWLSICLTASCRYRKLA